MSVFLGPNLIPLAAYPTLGIMVIVSNTSPITNLAAVGHIDLLRLLYGSIIIPEQVYNELIGKGGPNNPGAAEAQAGTWIETRQATDTAFVQRLQRLGLDAGEAEAIVLASELNADLLLIDEKDGRQVAASFGVPHIGLLGVLLNAKAQSLIPLVKPTLDALLAGAPGPQFRLSRKLYIAALQQAGESP
jgi:predicted nucleic acid-binding protein